MVEVSSGRIVTKGEEAPITEEEATLYDRQIRLWGVESQTRLKHSNVLIVGMSGLGAEITKNILLAGINSLTIVDDKTVDEEDYESNFLLEPDSIGKNRAQCCLTECAELNPMVKIEIEKGAVADFDAEFFKKFTIICLADQPILEQLRVDKICRAVGVPFVSASVFGWYGFGFFDFLKHVYSQEISSADTSLTGEEIALDCVSSDDEGDSAPIKKPKVSSDQKIVQIDDDSTTVEKTEFFTSLQLAFDSSQEGGCKGKTIRKRKRQAETTKGFSVFKTLLLYEEKFGRIKADDPELIMKNLESLEPADCEKNKLETLAKMSRGQLNPVCAITGGLVAQEIIKAISAKDKPLNNFFFYDGPKTVATVKKVPSNA